jgi:hypothetical protein
VTRVFSALNARQFEVLRWIADGCPADVVEGYSHKTTAVALQSRRLVNISKRGGVWRAVVTDAGAYYLQHGKYCTTTETGRAPNPDPPRPAPSLDIQPPQHPRTVPQAVRPKVPSPTEQLISELAASGEVKVSGPDRAKYEARMAAAIRFSKVPAGKQLVSEGGRWSREYVIRLRDAPAWLNADLDPIPVPGTLRQPHPVVISLQTGKRLVGLDRSVTHRALLIIQALAREAERRGYTVRETEVTTDAYGYQRRETKDHFTVAISRYSVGVQLRQEVNRARHAPTAAEQAKAATDRWYRIPKYDVTPSDRLSIHLSGRFEHRQSKWADAPSGSLDGWLPQVLQEMELRAKAAEQERLAAIAEAEQRRRQWEQAMKKAKADYTEAFRANVLIGQVDNWLRTHQIRDYLDAMRERIDNIIDPDDAIAAKEWYVWVEEWVSSADPLLQRLGAPEVPEPKPDDLKPFLKGWNPYGPDGFHGIR